MWIEPEMSDEKPKEANEMIFWGDFINIIVFKILQDNKVSVSSFSLW